MSRIVDVLWNFPKQNKILLIQDRHLLIGSIALYCLVGLLTLYSASSFLVNLVHLSPAYFVMKQLFFIFLGLAAFFAVQTYQLEKLTRIKVWWWMFFSSIIVGYAVINGVIVNGDSGWIRLFGSNVVIRAGDLITVLHLMMMVRLYFYDQEYYQGRRLPLLLLLIQASSWVFNYGFRDMGAIAVTVGVSLFVLLAFEKYAGFALLFAVDLALLGVSLWFAPYWGQRMLDILRLSDPYAISYQVIISIEQMLEGGVWGRWEFFASEVSRVLPESHLGFIFSPFVRNAGLAGMLLFMLFLLTIVCMSLPATKVEGVTAASVFTVVFGGMFSVQCLVGITTAIGLFLPNNEGIPLFSPYMVKTVCAFILFGLLYRCCKDPASRFKWKEILFRPVALAHILLFTLIWIKLFYHMFHGVGG